jgi:hypothetical protein
MTNYYTIQFETELRLMRATLSGFWNIQTVSAFLTEIEEKESKLKAAGKPYFVMTDLTEFPVQTREVVDELEHHLKAWSNAGSFSAIISSSALAELQVKRIAVGGNRRYFTSKNDAMDWLVSKGMTAGERPD